MLQLARYSFETSKSQPHSTSGFSSRDSPFFFSTKLDPPTGFSDSVELSEAECDLDIVRNSKISPKHTHTRDFTIAV